MGCFPPIPVYPEAIDSDFTLFLVYNTTETKLAADNSPWSQEVPIVPVAPNKNDIWADNGFANISGELFYYDAVEKNEYGKVVKLKTCSRNIGGTPTQFNRCGTWVRSYVVAEHHNQIVDTILQIEDFVGFNFDPRIETLDWRIRNLEATPVIFDDFNCPDVNFTFNVVSVDNEAGVVADYLVELSGTFNNFRLDFGDGEFTTTVLEGSHTYALNATIDPVITISNDKCQIVQTPIERLNPQEPPPEIVEAFDIPIPEVPDFPDFTFVPCEVPEPDINLPPLVFPCISIEGQIGPIPSSIEGPDLPSVISIISPDIPSVIIFDPPIPSIIIIDPFIPPTIVIDPPIPPTIVIVPPASSIAFDLNVENMPKLEVDWGRAPDMEVALTFAQEVAMPRRLSADPDMVAAFGEEFADLFEASHKVKVDYKPVGIPSEIMIIPPVMPKVEFDTDSLKNIKIEAVNIPTDIKIHGPDEPIPTDIRLNAQDVPRGIDLNYRGPEKLEIDASMIPTKIILEMEKPIPERIIVDMPRPIPTEIFVRDSLPREIEIKGMPSFVELRMPKDFGIPVLFPAEMPKMELVYNGAPVEMKITMDKMISQSEDDGSPCVKIIPCPR